MYLFTFPDSVSTKNESKSAYKKTLESVTQLFLDLILGNSFSLIEIISNFKFEIFKINRTQDFSELPKRL